MQQKIGSRSSDTRASTRYRSSDGCAESRRKTATDRDGLIKPHVHPQGYLALGLYREKRHRTFRIHNLVARAFIGPQEAAIATTDGDWRVARWFYRDPLAAVWMEVHHGVRSENREHGYSSALQVLFTDVVGLRDARTPAPHGQRFHIHPESLHLLEPHVGDLVSLRYDWHGVVKDVGGQGEVYVGVDDYGPGTRPRIYPLMALSAKGLVPGYNSIIQRNGKAFHWPES